MNTTQKIEDPLTRLHNRVSFLKLLQRRILDANEYHSKLALVLINVNQLNRINHQHGYDAGDEVLCQFANLLEEVRREQDHVARIGDNRFVLLLRDVMNKGHAKLAALKVLKCLEQPFEVNGEKILLTVTIGIGVSPIDASETFALLKVSEKALLLASQSNQLIGFITGEEDDELSDIWDIEIELVGAIDNSQLVNYYQPKVSLITGKPTGAEALMRWNSPSRGFTPPNVFIPVAEKMGFIKPMTNWLINTALRESKEWTKKFGPLSVSVNVPPQLLLEHDFVDNVSNALEMWKGNDTTLTIEIIERSFISNADHTFKVLKKLRDLGVKISIDDFGTGFSSLSYFKMIPCDELKVDQSFVFDLLKEKANSNIVKLIVQLAHSFDLTVVAEGVETLDILSALKQLNCDDVQGYLLCKPIPQKDVKSWFEKY